MTDEEKQLLLKDLCARLPYGLMAHASEINKNGIITDVNITYNMVNLTVDNANGKYELVPLLDIKPYLRPMSSMTGKEETAWHELTFGQRWITFDNVKRCADWLNSHHIDYRGLIEKGLALEAPKNLYKNC